MRWRATGKAMVHIDGGLHATEVAGAQHTIQLAYNLVTGNTPEINSILDNVILLSVVFDQSRRPEHGGEMV